MNKRILSLGLVCVSILFAMPACKSDGGSGGDGGGGSTSTGTVTGTDDCSQCWPQCFLDMFAPCTPSGACTQQSTTGGTGATVNVCYDNGVKATTGVGATGASTTYYKADGSVCFTGESAYSGSTVTATYKDASGAVLLTDTTASAGSQVQTIVCGGKTYMVDPSSAACTACQTGGMSSSCTNGTCAAP
jgi:hypothetical protein